MKKDNNGVTITLPDNGMCALVKKVDGRYEIDTGRVEGKDVFLGPQPDPETGLVPCGCGGKAELHPAGGIGNNDVMAECTTCSVAVICVTKEEAIRVWNEAMGYKEDEE
jgi:hypothetical protein